MDFEELDAFLRMHPNMSAVGVAGWLADRMGEREPLPADEMRKLAQTVRDRRAALGLPQVDISKVRSQDAWPWGAVRCPDKHKEV